MRMNIIESRPRCAMWAMALALALGSLAAGCSKDPILGSNGMAAVRPAVTVVMPADGATGVLTTNTLITATMNEPVAPITGAASMTLTCAAPCVTPTGAVTLDPTNTIATFTPTPGTTLATLTQYTVTMNGATSLASGVAMAGPYTWQFTTVAAPSDLTRPRVSVTTP